MSEYALKSNNKYLWEQHGTTCLQFNLPLWIDRIISKLCNSKGGDNLDRKEDNQV